MKNEIDSLEEIRILKLVYTSALKVLGSCNIRTLVMCTMKSLFCSISISDVRWIDGGAYVPGKLVGAKDGLVDERSGYFAPDACGYWCKHDTRNLF